MNKYLIQYSKSHWEDGDEGYSYIKQPPVVRNFTDQQLEDFCKNKEKVKVTFLCKIEKEKEDWDLIR